MTAETAPQDDSPVILVQGLSKSYNMFKKVKALVDVNLEVRRGDIFALIGPNGAGKTTLMGCLLGLLKPHSGTIKIFGYAPDDYEVRSISSFLPERPSFDSWMTARQFLKFHHMLSQRPAASQKEDIEAALRDVELTDVADRKIAKFSRGMLQRLGLAQVIIGNPQLCFLDEPTSGMDPLGMELIRNLLVRFRSEGKTVILNSHHLDEVERVCNRFAFMRKGVIEAQEAVGSTNTKVLIVRWSVDTQPESETIATSATTVGVELVENSAGWARFILQERADASALIRTLVQNQIEIEEAFFEKSSLSELFHSPMPVNGEKNGVTAMEKTQ